MANISWWAVLPLAAALGAGCTVPETATGLRPEGPPMVQQVFLDELIDNAGVLRRNDDILAFGWHPNVANMRTALGEVEDKTHPTTSATASNQVIRVVLDELLIGNFLEEIACRDRSWSRVPVGATPDDIANCAVPNDLLAQFCVGPMATCLVNGAPVGVVDDDENGSPDDTRMQCDSEDNPLACTHGPVSLRCGDIYVPLDRQATFWQPAGNQLVPARQNPSASLGPAIVISPLDQRLPPSSTCYLEFKADVVDKDFNRICVPKGGVEDTDFIGDCEAGDLTGFSFGTESIRRDSSSPSRGATGVPTNDRMHYIELTGPIDPPSAPTATTVVMEGAGTRTDVTVSIAPPTRINFLFAADLLPNTTYTITISGLRDTFGQPIGGTIDNSFTTAP